MALSKSPSDGSIYSSVQVTAGVVELQVVAMTVVAMICFCLRYFEKQIYALASTDLLSGWSKVELWWNRRRPMLVVRKQDN